MGVGMAQPRQLTLSSLVYTAEGKKRSHPREGV